MARIMPATPTRQIKRREQLAAQPAWALELSLDTRSPEMMTAWSASEGLRLRQALLLARDAHVALAGDLPEHARLQTRLAHAADEDGDRHERVRGAEHGGREHRRDARFEQAGVQAIQGNAAIGAQM